MSARLAHMRTMLGLLASGKEPYGSGRWYCVDHVKVYADDAQVLVDMIDELMRLRGEIQKYQANITTGGPAPAFTSRPYHEGDPVQVDLPDCDCCGGNPRTVCDACGQHACWAGTFMCEDAQTAGTRDE